jgi:DNA-binding transcriptional LysR family regulator
MRNKALYCKHVLVHALPKAEARGPKPFGCTKPSSTSARRVIAMSQLPDLEAWAIFAKVAERGSFSNAAKDLGLAKTTVSKAVSRLEARMRTTLFHRTTRKLSLTETGRLSLERAARILADGTAIEQDVIEEAAVPRGHIRAAALTAFGEDRLAPLLPRFLSAYPEIDLELILIDKPVDIVAEGFDLAIQIGSGSDSSLRASRLYSVRRPVTATPALLERCGMPQRCEDLHAMPALITSHVPQSEELHFVGPGGQVCTVRLTAMLRMNSARALVPSLLAGQGFATVPELYVADELRSGALIELLPEWTLADGEVYVVTPPGRARPARVSVFIDFLREHFTGDLPHPEQRRPLD